MKSILIAAVVLGALHCLPLSAAAQTAAPSTSNQSAPSWRSQSLREQPTTGPNGIVTTAEALGVNAKLGAEKKAAIQVAPGIYALAGWGIAASYAIDAPGGWIVIDTGDNNQAASEMRKMLEQAVGRRIKVAAILFTHWHYTNGTAAWLDAGTQTWGHERLDANRSIESGLSPFRGVAESRAIAQFGILHPTTGPDAFPSVLGFTPEKLFGETSYQPPKNLFPDGKVVRHVIAGETVEVAPMRTDSTDSVAFWFPQRKLLITNFTVTPFIFNIFTLRGGRHRDPMIMVNDARWLEGKNAELLLDIQNAPIKGRTAVQQALERSIDQVQQIHDQTIRLISQGLDARQATETITMSPALRNNAELYGQVESHVRAVWNNQRGWFGSDVYDINPLGEKDEAARLISAMGGAPAVRDAAAKAAAAGGIDNWRWTLKLTSLLLTLDPADAAARATRATAARALGQRTTAANARGFYITEALQMENRLLAQGQPVTIDLLRRLQGTPSKEQLTEAPPAEVLDYLRFMVDPAKAGDKRVDFTLAVAGDPAIRRVLLRNGVLVIGPASKAGPVHVTATRAQLADFVLGATPLPGNHAALSGFAEVFDRSQFLTLERLKATQAGTVTDNP